MQLFSEYRGLRRDNYILFIGRVMTSLGSMVWPMFTLILSQKLGMKAAEIAFYNLLFSLAGIPLNLLGGKLADHYSKKNLIIICDLMSVLAGLYCVFTPLSLVSMLVFATGAILQNMEGPAYSALVADITPAKDRERAYSLNYFGLNLGMVLAPTISGMLFKNHLWLMFLINSLAIGTSTVLIALFLKDTKVDEKTNRFEEARDHTNVFTVLKENPVILLFIIIVAIQTTIYSQYGYMMPLELGTVHGQEGAVLYGTVSSLNCIVVVLLTPSITKLFRRVSDCGKLLAGQLFIVAGYICFKLFLGFIPSYYAAMVIFTIGEIFCTLSCDPYLTKRIPASHRGRVVSLNGVAGNLLYSVFQLALGFVYDEVGSLEAWILIFAGGTIGIVLTLILLRKDRRTYGSLYEVAID